MSNGNSAEASTSPSPAPSSIGNNAPKFGTLVPNRVFVGGISGNTTEQDLLELFTKYGKVKATKVISDRAGVSKGYGFVTFETEEEARKLTLEGDNIMLKDRKLNIAPAIKKQVNEIGGYIKPYSPRLVDGTAATVLGANGTVIFGNGTTYAYTNPMPVLANPSEYHQAVAGVPTPSAAHPTFPPQVPQTGAHTTVSAATQVGAPHGAGYPTQFVYPQTMYIPQQYQQFQTPAIQPQWTTSPQWRWVPPNAFAQPGTGYITSDGLYTQAAATYVPESSSLNGEVTSIPSCPKGDQTSPIPSASSPSTPYYLSSLTLPHCFLTNTHHSSPPIAHSHHHNSSTPPTSGTCSSPVGVAVASSSTAITTTITTAGVRSRASFTGVARPCEAIGNGVLDIKPLFVRRGSETDYVEMESTKPLIEHPKRGIDSSQLSQDAFSTPPNRCSSSSGSLAGASKTFQNDSHSSPSNSSCSVEGSVSRLLLSSPSTSSHPPSCKGLGDLHALRKRGRDDTGTPPDRPSNSASNGKHSSLASPTVSALSSPLPTVSQGTPNGPTGANLVNGRREGAWCPKHKPRPLPLHVWSQSSFPHQQKSPRGGAGKNTSASPQRRSSESSGSHRGIPPPKEPLFESHKSSGGREEFLAGNPFLKVEGSGPGKSSFLYGMTPQMPLMVVPWCHYGPSVTPSWIPWSPFVSNNCLLLPPQPTPTPHCSFHPPTPTSPLPNSHTLSGLDNIRPAGPGKPQPLPHPSQSPRNLPSRIPSDQNVHWEVTTHCNSRGSGGSFPLEGNVNGSYQKKEAVRNVTAPPGAWHASSSCVPSASGSNLPCYNSIRRPSHPYVGETPRCLHRLMQLPYDRCAYVSLSPPLTPLQIDVDSRELSPTHRNN